VEVAISVIEWIKLNIKKLIIAGVIMVIIIPSATYALSTIPVLPMGGNNDWAGFWGGYLGAIVGGVITLYVMFKSFQDSRENQERVLEIERLKEIKKEKIQFCNYIVEQFAILKENTNWLIAETVEYTKTGDLEIRNRARESNRKEMRIESIISIQLSIREKDSNYFGIGELRNSIGLLMHMLYHISKCSEIEPNMLHKINHDKINELKKSIFKDMEDIERKIIVFIEKNLDFCK
jgi:hypothetical protein